MKKCRNVGLLGFITAITMVTAAACGSKEEVMVLDDWAETESDSFSETAVDADTAGIVSVDDWADSSEAITYVKAFNNVYAENGITMELAAENDTLSMILIYSEEALKADISELTDEQMEEVYAMMQQQYDEIEEQLISDSKVLKQEVGASTIHIVYKASDGTELFSKDL